MYNRLVVCRQPTFLKFSTTKGGEIDLKLVFGVDNLQKMSKKGHFLSQGLLYVATSYNPGVIHLLSSAVFCLDLKTVQAE